MDPQPAKVGQRLGGHARSRLPLLYSSVAFAGTWGDLFESLYSIPRYVRIPRPRDNDDNVSFPAASSARPFPHAGIVYGDP
jgi:hypothetical protein